MTGPRSARSDAEAAGKRRLDRALEEGLEEIFPARIRSASPSRRPPKPTTTSSAANNRPAGRVPARA